ncbi:hypothetical protein LUZ61_009180 [Rhynchospora tenuis]|uniref:Uncharacterized protein n=1 Tax=Rhynchospora tenuis TaxID=198213 RepID=A0AAD6EYB2_9POAL|nr:hypothetical protein LUZ61_009180 [Rhynchospora tenuis]
MPTYTSVALDRLLAPGSRNTSQKPPPAPVRLDRAPTPIPSPRKPIPRRQMTPSLCTTPETTPMQPDSPSSPSSYPPSSPYIINHKRRGPRLMKSQSLGSDDGGSKLSEIVTRSQSQTVVPVLGEEEAQTSGEKLVEEMADILQSEQIEEEVDAIEENSKEFEFMVSGMETVRDEEKRVEKDEFLDLQESLSTISEDGFSTERSYKPSTPMGEFYDAFEEISSESGAPIPSRGNNIEEELREIRLSLLMEIEKRKQAEEAVESLRNQWMKLSNQLSLVGLHLPPPPPIFTERNGNCNSSNFELDPVEELSQQIIVSRLVSDAISKGISRTEVEAEIEPIIQSKNFEISRLMDRVQYYEFANREMSQRNQEAVEMARQQRNRRKRRQKWILASVGLAVTVGAAAIAWQHLPSKSVLSEQKIPTSTAHTSQK